MVNGSDKRSMILVLPNLSFPQSDIPLRYFLSSCIGKRLKSIIHGEIQRQYGKDSQPYLSR